MKATRLIATLFLSVLILSGRRSDGSDLTNGRVQRALPKASESSEGSYQLDFTLVEVNEDTDVTALAIKFFHSAIRELQPSPEHSFTKLQCDQCHDISRTKDAAPEVLWKAILDNRDALKTWVSDSQDVSVLARPSLIVAPGRTAVVDARSEQSFEYLRRREDGLFELKEKLLKTGIALRATVDAREDEHHVRLDPVSVSVTAIKEREKIQGVNLPPVGMPLLTTTSIETSLVTKLAESQIISIDSPKGGRVLIAVKVRRTSGRNGGSTSVQRGAISVEGGTGLTASVSVRFTNKPLGDVLSDLTAKTGLKLSFDDEDARNWSVTIRVTQPITVKSALNLILEPLRLGYTVLDGELIIRAK